MKSRQLSRSIELRVNCYGKVAISTNPNFFVTEEKQKRNEKVRDKMEVAKNESL